MRRSPLPPPLCLSGLGSSVLPKAIRACEAPERPCHPLRRVSVLSHRRGMRRTGGRRTTEARLGLPRAAAPWSHGSRPRCGAGRRLLTVRPTERPRVPGEARLSRLCRCCGVDSIPEDRAGLAAVAPGGRGVVSRAAPATHPRDRGGEGVDGHSASPRPLPHRRRPRALLSSRVG